MAILGILKVLLTADAKGFSGDVKKAKADIKDFKDQIPGLNSALSLLSNPLVAAGAGIGALVKFSKDAIADTQKYALEMSDLARTWGISVEEASKLVQVGDDLRISQDQMGQAFRFAIREGIQPNMEGIMKLAKEYQAIPDPVARSQFAMEKFGKFAGPQMQKMLELTPEALQDMAASAEKAGLVMTDKGVDAAEKYYASLDNLGDSADGLKMKLGTALIPIATDLVDTFNEGTGAAFAIGEELGIIADLVHQRLDPAYAAFVERQATINEMLENNEPYQDARDKIGLLTEAQNANAEAAADMAAENANVAYELMEVTKKAFAKEAIEALGEAYKANALDADAYREEMTELMGQYMDMTPAEIAATIQMAELKKEYQAGELDALEYSDAVERLYMKLKDLDGTEANTTITTTYQTVGEPAAPKTTTQRRRQHGGRVERGSAYLVGEAGMELFVPDVAGTIYNYQQTMNTIYSSQPAAAQREMSNEELLRAIRATRIDERMLGRVIRDALMKVE